MAYSNTRDKKLEASLNVRLLGTFILVLNPRVTRVSKFVER